MKLEPQITNNQSSLIDNHLKRSTTVENSLQNHLKRSTTVENSLQITPFYAKQSQFDGGPNEHKLRYEKQLQDFVPLTEPKNKANSKPIKPKTNPIKAKTKPIWRKGKKNESKNL